MSLESERAGRPALRRALATAQSWGFDPTLSHSEFWTAYGKIQIHDPGTLRDSDLCSSASERSDSESGIHDTVSLYLTAVARNSQISSIRNPTATPAW